MSKIPVVLSDHCPDTYHAVPQAFVREHPERLTFEGSGQGTQTQISTGYQTRAFFDFSAVPPIVICLYIILILVTYHLVIFIWRLFTRRRRGR